MATIRVSDQTQAKLKKIAEELRLELGRAVSMEEVLDRLLNSRRLKPSDFQGTWKMTDKEAQKLVADDKVYPDDPIFKNIERESKPGKKTQWSVDHDKILYNKP